MEGSCSKELLWTAGSIGQELCQKVSAACSSSQTYVDFYKMYYCHLQRPWLAWLILAVFLFYIFRFIDSVITSYVAPSLTHLSHNLGFSEATASITLIGFANGLGDIFGAYAAAQTQEAVPSIIGLLYGSCLFGITVIIAFTIFYAEIPPLVQRKPFLRDFTFFIASIALMVFFLRLGSIGVFKTALFFAMFAAQVILVIVKDVKARRSIRRSRIHIEELQFFNSIEDQDVERPRELSRVDKIVELKRIALNPEIAHIFKNFVAKVKNSSRKMSIDRPLDSKLEKFLKTIDYPFYFLRRITLLPSRRQLIEAHLFIFWPFAGIPLLIWAVNPNPQVTWLFYIPFAMVLSTIFALSFTSNSNIIANPKYMTFINFLGAFTGIFWVKILTSMLVDLTVFLVTFTGVNSTFMSMAIIGFGNNTSSLFTAISMARKGFADLSVAGTITVQNFNLLFGLGVGLVRTIIKNRSSIDVAVYKAKDSGNFTPEFLSLCLMVILGLMMIRVVQKRYSLPRRVGYELIILLSAFLTVSIYLILF